MAASRRSTGCSRVAVPQPPRRSRWPGWAFPTELITVVGDDIAGDLIVAGLTRAGVGTRFVDRGPAARSALSVGLIRPRPADTRSLVALSAVGVRIGVTDDALEACQAAAWIHVDHAGWPLVGLAAGTRGADPGRRRWWQSPGARRPVGRRPLRAGPDRAAPVHRVCDGARRAPDGCRSRRTRDHRDPGCGRLDTTWDRSIADTPDADGWFRERGDDPGTATGSAAATHGAHVPSPRVAVRSTLGAGDVYHGALLAGLLDGRSIRGAMAYASTAAALACRALDGRSAIPTHAEVLDHLASTEPHADDTR